VDAFGPRLSFFFYTYTNFFEEVAKYRAGRRIWARLMKERFKAKTASAQMMRAACVCGGHSLTRAEPLNNIARVTLEAFAVTCGGLQSVFTAAYDEAFAIPTELSTRTSLRVQQILQSETEVAKTVDPLGGSYFVEALTDQMEAEILKVMDEVEGQGGMVKALERGWVQQAIARRAYEWERAVQAGEQPVVGVNVHKTEEEQKLQTQALSPSAGAAKSQELKQMRANRTVASVQKSLDAIRKAAEGSDNLMPHIREAVLAYATVGEIAAALKDVWGTYQPPTRF
jgi:methylmalonyl-CoA mutase N-terminal domain/subunit